MNNKNKDSCYNFVSPRGYQLIGNLSEELSHPDSRPIVTVESYCTWYEIFLVYPDGKVESKNFGVLEDYTKNSGGSYFCDHVPNPIAVRDYCEANDYYFNDLAEELIIGRWIQETLILSTDEYKVKFIKQLLKKVILEEISRVEKCVDSLGLDMSGSEYAYVSGLKWVISKINEEKGN